MIILPDGTMHAPQTRRVSFRIVGMGVGAVLLVVLLALLMI